MNPFLIELLGYSKVDFIEKELPTIFIRPLRKEMLKVYSGSDAVKACQDNPGIYLVLMYIKMPAMDGYEATREIREFNKTVVIIAQTAFGFKDDRKNAMAAECNDYISKAIIQAAFNTMMHKHFNK